MCFRQRKTIRENSEINEAAVLGGLTNLIADGATRSFIELTRSSPSDTGFP
jgi:hypothetical protein